MSLDSGGHVWETIALVRIEWGLSAKTVTASVIIKTTIIILACVSSFGTVLPQTYQHNQRYKIWNFVEVNFKRAQESKM